jgi:hypothetical protein
VYISTTNPLNTLSEAQYNALQVGSAVAHPKLELNSQLFEHAKVAVVAYHTIELTLQLRTWITANQPAKYCTSLALHLPWDMANTVSLSSVLGGLKALAVILDPTLLNQNHIPVHSSVQGPFQSPAIAVTDPFHRSYLIS